MTDGLPSAASSIRIRVTSEQDEEYFFENLAMLLSAGIDLTAALTSIQKSVRSKAMKSVIGQILLDIDGGNSLSGSIKQKHLLPLQMAELLRIGEESGSLAENMTVIANQLEKDRVLRAKIASAMMYPVFVFSLTVIIGIGIAWFILPNLARVFDNLHVTLPFFTVILISIGKFLGSYGIFVIPLFFLLVLGIGILAAAVTPVKKLAQSVLLHLPVVRSAITQIELTRFGYIVGTLLNAGLPFPQTLELLSQSTGFYRYQQFYTSLQNRIDEGNTLTQSIEGYRDNERFIPAPFQELISAAESSGKLAPTLLRIGQIAEAKTDILTNNLTSLLEPVLLVIVWLGVLWVAVSVIVPIYSLIGGLNSVTGP